MKKECNKHPFFLVSLYPPMSTEEAPHTKPNRPQKSHTTTHRNSISILPAGFDPIVTSKNTFGLSSGFPGWMSSSVDAPQPIVLNNLLLIFYGIFLLLVPVLEDVWVYWLIDWLIVTGCSTEDTGRSVIGEEIANVRGVVKMVYPDWSVESGLIVILTRLWEYEILAPSLRMSPQTRRTDREASLHLKREATKKICRYYSTS